jgi:hypothetical protein
MKKAHELFTTGHTGFARHSPREGFTTYFVLSPVNGLCCHRRPREALASQELDASVAAPGPHDFAVCGKRSRPARFSSRLKLSPSIASRAQRVVTIAKRPSLSGHGTRESLEMFCPTTKAENFCGKGWIFLVCEKAHE